MALNNRIYKYKCDVCNRSIERVADPARPDPLGCVITDQCSGKLTLVNTRFGLRPINTPTVVGLLDRVKRGAPRTTVTAAKALDRVNLSTFSGSGGLTVAMLKSVETVSERVYYVTEDSNQRVLARTPLIAALPVGITVTAVLFELTPAALEYKRYTYVRAERCIYVEGKDDSAAQNPLAFDDASNVRVLVNGALLQSSLYDKTVHGTITFTPELEDASLLIEVFVYKSLTQFFSDEQAIRLQFTMPPQYDAARTGSAWGDAARAGEYAPLHCADISALDVSRSYGLVRFETVDETAAPVVIDPQGHFLLASPPYAFQDKRLTAVVPLAAFTSEGFPLGFAVNSETGSVNAVVDGETLTPLTRPLIVGVLDTLTTTREAETVGLVVAHNEKKFILGPT